MAGSNLYTGTLDLLVLKTLESMGPLNGYRIARRIEQLSENHLALNQGSIYWLDVIGYLLTLSGDWDRGPDLIRKAMQVNPFA